MLRRGLALLFLAWAIGFLWFGVTLPRPAGSERTDAVIVLTGGEGRISRAIEALQRGWARQMLVSGVDRNVKPREFAAVYGVTMPVMTCCVTLGFESRDTIGNASEAARWIAARKVRSVRLVTSDWHMRRAALEFERRVPGHVRLVEDAVPTRPSLRILFLEYHKLLARWIAGLWEWA